MVLCSGSARRKPDDSVLAVAYHNRKLAVATQTKKGFEVVVYHVDSGKPAFRKDIDSKIVHVQWKSNSALFVVTANFTLNEISIATSEVKQLQLSNEKLQERKWIITSAAVSKVSAGPKDDGIFVALALCSEKDIVESAIKTGIDLYGRNSRKAKLSKMPRNRKNEEYGEEEDEEMPEEEESEEQTVIAIWKFSGARKVEQTAFFEDSHSDAVHSMIFVENDLLMTGGLDGLVNVFNVNETDEDDAIQTTISAESAVAKISILLNGLIGIVTDDNKQIVVKKNAIDDFDTVHRKRCKQGRFLIDLVPGVENTRPVASVEGDSRGELVITAFNSEGRDSKILVRSYMHKTLCRFVTTQGNIVAVVDDDSHWSAYNLTKTEENIVEEQEPPAEEEVKPRRAPFKRDFSEGRGGFSGKKVFKQRTFENGDNNQPKQAKSGVVDFENENDDEEHNNASDSQADAYKRFRSNENRGRQDFSRRPRGDRGGRGQFRGSRGGGGNFHRDYDSDNFRGGRGRGRGGGGGGRGRGGGGGGGGFRGSRGSSSFRGNSRPSTLGGGRYAPY